MIPANNHPEIDRLIHLKKHLGGMTIALCWTGIVL